MYKKSSCPVLEYAVNLFAIRVLLYFSLALKIISTYDLNQQHPLGYSEVLLNIANGYRQSSAYTFLKPIKERTNLYVVNHTTVTKILFDENKNAVGVVAVTEDGRIKTYLATK